MDPGVVEMASVLDVEAEVDDHKHDIVHDEQVHDVAAAYIGGQRRRKTLTWKTHNGVFFNFSSERERERKFVTFFCASSKREREEGEKEICVMH